MKAGNFWLRDNSHRRELAKLLRTWCFPNGLDGDGDGNLLDVRDVILSGRGRFLVGAMISHAIEINFPDAVAIATVKAEDDCLALAATDHTVGTFRSRERGRIRFEVLNAFNGSFYSEANLTRYLEEFLELRSGDEVVIVVGVARSSSRIRASVELIRSRGLAVRGCFALVNDLEDDVDLGVELVSIYVREEFDR